MSKLAIVKRFLDAISISIVGSVGRSQIICNSRSYNVQSVIIFEIYETNRGLWVIWVSLGHLGVLGSFGDLWVIWESLGHLGVSGSFGGLWVILGCFSGLLVYRSFWPC